jgi:hypothetical protein
MFATRKQFPGELLSPVAAIPLKMFWRSLYEFARRESDLPHRFQSPPLSYIRKLTDQPATHIAYCLLMLIIYAHILFFQIFIYTFALSLKPMYN